MNPPDPYNPYRMVTIFYRPRDCPGVAHIARVFYYNEGVRPGEIIATGNLDQCRRAAVAAGCDTRTPRVREDDPAIVETWI